jgi:hypothetical protein
MMNVGTAFLPGWLVDLGGVLSDPLGLVRCSGCLKMRVSPTILAAGAALLVPHAAQAAYLAPLDPCYRSVDSDTREMVPVRASGFTPGEHVNVYVDGMLAQQDVVVLTDGQITGFVSAPYVPSGERDFTLTVTEVEQPSNTASVTSRVTALSLRLKPSRARPNRRVRIIGSGFIDGTDVYAHYVRKRKLRKTVRLGPPQGPCGRIDVKRRQIPLRRPALGRWTLQVDNQKAYSPRPDSVFMTLSIRVTEGPRRIFPR